jgi:hypothetical protein
VHLVPDDTEAEVDMPNNGGMYGILLANSESNCNNNDEGCLPTAVDPQQHERRMTMNIRRDDNN